MNLHFSENGTLTAICHGKTVIDASPVGTAYKAGILYAPVSADVAAHEVRLHFPVGDVRLGVHYDDAVTHARLTLLEAPDLDAFVFGPYIATDAVKYGELVGAGWRADGSAVCIQSLNPKTVGGCHLSVGESRTDYIVPHNQNAEANNVATRNADGTITLQCTVEDMSRPTLGENNRWIAGVEGEDGLLAGASVALTAADSPEELLGILESIELAYGLPHPTIDGEWNKTSPKTSEIYFVINSGTPERQVELAERAGIRCVYFSDPFKSWGHFDINRDIYPGGLDEFREFIAYCRSHGVDTGFHTLSNFLHTHDPYVSPVPHKELLIRDKTVLCADITEADTVLPIRDRNSYGEPSALNALRIDDELITFDTLDGDNLRLLGCKRGAFGTSVTAHKAGTEVHRLWEYSYCTLFPSLALQGEVAENIGRMIRQTGIRRMSFDGIEGCCYTGRGEYACSEFVRRVFEAADCEFICDASRGSHYRWHAHSYFNWGEPWWEDDRRGGMYNYRAGNQEFFRANLLPGMLGWYKIWNADGAFEPTTPEVMEYILSRNVAFDAGSCICIDDEANGMLGLYLDMVRLWGEFRKAGVVTEDVKARMREKKTDWHLEKTEDAWLLTELEVTKHNMLRGEGATVTESGTTGHGGGSICLSDGVIHRSNVVFDRHIPGCPAAEEPLCFRIRAGHPGKDTGTIREMKFYEGWFGVERLSLTFRTDIAAGDYVEYRGGTKLYHYDCNLNLIDSYEASGDTVNALTGSAMGMVIHYVTEQEASLHMELTHIQTKRVFRFPIADGGNGR